MRVAAAVAVLVLTASVCPPRSQESKPALDFDAAAWQQAVALSQRHRDDPERNKGLAMLRAFIEKWTPKQLDQVNALHDLVRLNLDKDAQRLLERGAYVDARDKDGQTALHVAVLGQQPRLVGLLIKHKADLNAADRKELTPLLHAVYQACHRMTHQGGTLMHGHPTGIAWQAMWAQPRPGEFATVAPSREAEEVLRLLLKAGADLQRGGPKGLTPLHLAAVIEDEEKTLLFAGLDSSRGTVTIFGDLIYDTMRWGYHSPDVVEALLQAGARVDAKTTHGLTPLDLAATPEVRQRLEKAGGKSGLASLPGLAGAVAVNDLTRLRKHKGKDDVNAASVADFTPLTWALFQRQDEMVPLLLKRGADPARRDGHGLSPLWLALSANNLDALAQLLATGAPADTPLGKAEQSLISRRLQEPKYTEGIRPLAVAAGRQDVRLLRLLLAFDADPTHPVDDYGNTALHHAAGRVDATTIRLLLDHGADRKARNQQGQTPLEWLPSEAPAELRKLLDVAK
jgi:ankyrin repeat protein